MRLVCALVGVLVPLSAAQDPAFNFVTCGSSIKLAHVRTGARLHSHEVKYGSDGGSSGQNSVTGMNTQIDANSMWKVVEGSGALEDCHAGKPIPCGSTIRLKHTSTGCFLHSHEQFRSPLSKNQEVSAVGCPSSPNLGPHGDRDPGDDWTLVCKFSSDGWMRDDQVRLKHVTTGRFLHHTGQHVYQRPINGQREICAVDYEDENGLWIAQEGVYVKRKDSNQPQSPNHEEL
eukprot:m.139402 g.139402  ORF g.139402 m.139402 type:complete len:231 (+) comp11500_c0_seq1:91-783(+)